MPACSGRCQSCPLWPARAPSTEAAESSRESGKGGLTSALGEKVERLSLRGAGGGEMGREGGSAMADRDPFCLQGSNCSLLCYSPYCAIRSKNTEGRSGYHRHRVCVFKFVYVCVCVSVCVLGFISTPRRSFGNYARGFTHGGFGVE